MMRAIRSQRWDMDIVVLSVVTVGIAIFLWNAPLLLPLKLFVVLLHEISHGLAALLTGGSIERLSLSPNEGGWALTRGGSSFLITSAGYLGSALWGALLLRLAWAKPGARRLALRAMTLALGLVGLLYARDLFTFGYIALSALALYGLGWESGPRLQLGVLWFVGTFSCLYAVIDISTDILMAGPLAGIPFLGGPVRMTDAEALASMTFIPAFIWGLVWCAVAIATYLASVAALATQRDRITSL